MIEDAITSNSMVTIEEDFTLSPNPTIDLLFINTKIKSCKLNIIDISGRVIYTTNGNQSTELDTSPLTQGTYLLTLKTDNTIIRRNFQKAN